MTEQTNALDVVAGLMRERQKYEGWMEALEARRASAPSHVFERVAADYEKRLLEVMRQLGEHSPVLEAQARTLDTRLAALADDERSKRDLRAEAELRSHVGELSEEDWSALAAESDGELSALAQEQERVRAELDQVRELLAAATTPPRGLTPVGQPAVDSAPAPATEASFDPAASLAGGETTEPAPIFDATVDDAVPGPSSAEPISPEQPEVLAEAEVAAGPAGGLVSVESLSSPAEGAAPDRQQFDELEFLKSVADAVTPEAGLAVGAPQRPVDPSLGVTQGGPPVTPLADRRPVAAPMAANVTGNQPIVLRSETAQTKTLKCTDCGAMNFPTEWYCERCGAELAAL